jgi:PIN domain nuclease of toxin-antitoxin system
VTILDSQAVLALLTREPAAPEVAEILRDRDSMASIPATALAEVVDILIRRMGNRVEHVSETLDTLIASGVDVVPVDEETGRLAGLLRSRHWNRDRRPVSLVDCTVLATGMIAREPIATSDAALIGAARAEGHPVIVLPDSQGRLPA